MRARAPGRGDATLASTPSVTSSAVRRDAEAEAYYERYAVELADTAAVDEHMRGKQAHSRSHDDEAYRLYRKRFAGGAGSFPLVGTPRRIVDDSWPPSRRRAMPARR